MTIVGKRRSARMILNLRMPPNKALQTDKGKLSRPLHSQGPRQLAFAAELGC
jgi:hypothetical protein